jgi:glycerophosphoryl diester phosphodiesterase
MNQPLAAALARSVWHDFLRARRALIVFEALFKLLEAWLIVPTVALLLAVVLTGAGHVAVSNQDILAFLLTPAGALYAALFGSMAVALQLFEQAGLMVLAARAASGERPSLVRMLVAVFQKAVRLVQLGAVAAALLALAFAPFVLLAVLTYVLLPTQHDIYYYLNERPPVFWLAAGVGALLLLAALATALWLCVRWAFALPILLFEQQSIRAALRSSRERVRGAGWRIGLVLLGWLLGTLLLGAILEAGFRLVASAVLARTGESVVAILLLLLAQGGLLAALSFVTVVGLALLTRRLYLLRNHQLGISPPEAAETAPGTERPLSPWARRLAYLAAVIVLLAPLALWADLSRYTAPGPVVQVTAHRGHARAAPENTLSAIRKAIEVGADYAEVDVQQTADGTVVLLHDRDLKRVAGDSRRLDELSDAEVRKLDVGSWFSPAFAGERVPTLVEAIDLCRGRIKMNIELKLFGPDRRLAGEVARLVHEGRFEADCLITSFDYDALRELKRHNPRLRTGLIVAHALGDVSRLEVDALSVRADFLSAELMRAARRHGREVHVWTVNDPRQMTRLMMRGVDNIITSSPDVGVRARDRWAGLTGPERLVLASRLLLGLDP